MNLAGNQALRDVGTGALLGYYMDLYEAGCDWCVSAPGKNGIGRWDRKV